MKLVSTILVALFLSTAGQAATPADELASYSAIFSGDVSQHSDAADTFAWMGLSDPRLFDIIEKRLLADHAAARGDRHEKNRVARYIRSLGFSGQEKYTATLQMFLTDKVYERYAKAALEDMQNYRRWNPIISNRATFDPAFSDDANRVMNMLRADDLFLKELGAKRVYFGVHDAVVLELLAKQVQDFCFTPGGEHLGDAKAWLVKGLSSAKQEKYRELVLTVAKTAPEPAVVKHAKKALERDYGNSLK